ncbi:MAG: leucyl aminopeptidase [Acidobacteriota bacterium]|nr:leucyl aminopeptidase [Acidobacteriota bacterium]
MFSIASVPALDVSSASPAEIDTDILAVPVFEGESLDADLRALDGATGGALARALESSELQGRLYDFFVTPVSNGWRARRVAFVGAGTRRDYTTERLRRVATAVALHARQRRSQRLAWVHRGDLPLAAAVQAAAEGLSLSLFSSDSYRSGERAAPPLVEMVIIAGGVQDAAGLRAAAERGRILGESCNIARELSNEPSNVLTPSVFADRAVEISRAAGLQVDVLDERAIADLGMGLLLGISRGSAEPPRVIVMRHNATAAPDAPVLGLVGKGVTFDTGGISIKPADGMERMKDDMAGGAAVICAMRAISLLKAPIKVIGVVPATENMPGGRAVKPGDVLTSASGKTVEVINTDAEGRLILGDGLWYARKLGATHLVDVATLTGAAVVALGKSASALFGRPAPWVDAVGRAADAAGDRCWPMPLYEEYSEQLRSDIADLINSGGRPAGACTAAMFLKEFAGDGPWAHLDVAGTAWMDEAKPWMPKGPSGVAVRTLAELAFTSANWK